MENKPKMQIAMQMGSGYGLDQGAWQMPNAYPDAYTNIDLQIELAKIAERGKINGFGSGRENRKNHLNYQGI